MLTPSISDFFDLKLFEHLELFNNVLNLYDPLERLVKYLEGFSRFRLYSPFPSHAHIENKEKVFIGKDVIIEPGAFIKGPCIIEAHAVISHCCLVRPYSIISRGAYIGHCSEVKGSIVLEGARLPHFNYVGDSIIGSRVNLGAGSICANVRLDKKDVCIKIGENRIATKRNKLGAIIGDGASIACNVVLNPGALIPKGAFVR